MKREYLTSLTVILLWISLSSSLVAGQETSDKDKSVETYFQQGERYFEARQFDKAIDSFRSVIKLRPESAVAYNNLAMSYAGMGLHAQAIECLLQATKLKPGYAVAHNNLGRR